MCTFFKTYIVYDCLLMYCYFVFSTFFINETFQSCVVVLHLENMFLTLLVQNSPLCSLRFNHATYITIHVVPRKQFFKIFLKTWKHRQILRNDSWILMDCFQITDVAMLI